MQGPFPLWVDDLCVSFPGCTVLDGVRLKVRPGELACILGPSGCGKTTLLRAIAGFVAPDRGQVIIGDREVVGSHIFVPPEQRNIGMVFQDYGLFPHLSVLDNVRFGLRRKTHSPRKAQEILDWLDLGHVIHAFPQTLSGGQQQRVAVARALAPGPQVLLLDEPFSSLDVLSRRKVRDRVLHLLKDQQVTAILVTHDPEEALFMADHIAVLRSGCIEQAGSPEDLVLRSASPEIASMFGETNILSACVYNGKITTPLGILDAGNLEEGVDVTIAMRSNSFQLLRGDSSHGQGVAARIIASRMMGDGKLLHLEVEDFHLHCRVALSYPLPENGWVRIELDPGQALIFPRSEVDMNGDKENR